MDAPIYLGFLVFSSKSWANWALPKVELGKKLYTNTLGKFDHDLTAIEPWESWFLYGNHPQMALIQIYDLARILLGPVEHDFNVSILGILIPTDSYFSEG